MPNMVDNIVSIVGPYAHLSELYEAVKERKLLQTIKPLNTFSEERAKETWGVKWDVVDEKPILHDEVYGYGPDMWCLEMQFESPWMPPIGAYEILTEEGLKVSAYFMDTSGQDYGGTFIEGETKTYNLEDLPEDITAIFAETYDYERLMYPDEWPDHKPAA